MWSGRGGGGGGDGGDVVSVVGTLRSIALQIRTDNSPACFTNGEFCDPFSEKYISTNFT